MKKPRCRGSFGIWSGKRDSNSRPQPWQGCALPTELFPLGEPCILQVNRTMRQLLQQFPSNQTMNQPRQSFEIGAGNESCTRTLSRCSQTLPSLKWGSVKASIVTLFFALSNNHFPQTATDVQGLIPSRTAPHATPHRSRVIEQAMYSHHRMPTTASHPNWACTYTDGSQTQPDFACQRGSGPASVNAQNVEHSKGYIIDGISSH